METLLFFGYTILTPLINSRYVVPSMQLDVWASFILPYLTLFGLIYIGNLLANIVWSWRHCSNRYGVHNGLRSGIVIGLGALVAYFAQNFIPVLPFIEFIFAFIPYIDVLASGIFVLIGVIISYLVSLSIWHGCN